MKIEQPHPQNDRGYFKAAETVCSEYICLDVQEYMTRYHKPDNVTFSIGIYHGFVWGEWLTGTHLPLNHYLLSVELSTTLLFQDQGSCISIALAWARHKRCLPLLDL